MTLLTPSIGRSISLPTKFGNLEIRHVQAGQKEGVVVTGSGALPNPLPVRIQSSCLFGESFLATNCDCAAQLHRSLEIVSAGGILVYLYEEGRGAGLKTKIEAIRVMDQENCDTAQAYENLGLQPDLRDYEAAASIVLQIAGRDREVTLITNNPNKVLALREQGVNVISRMPIVCSGE